MKEDIKDFFNYVGRGAVFLFYGMTDDEIRKTVAFQKYKKHRAKYKK